MDEKIKVRIMKITSRSTEEGDCPRGDRYFGQHVMSVLGEDTKVIVPFGCANQDANGNHLPCAILVLTDSNVQNVSDELIESVEFITKAELSHAVGREVSAEAIVELAEFAESIGLELVDDKPTPPAPAPTQLPRITIISNN